MSTQPSSRGRPSTFGTLRILVRYIGAPSCFAGGAFFSSLNLSAVRFTAFPSAAPIFSGSQLMIFTLLLSSQAAIHLMRGHEVAVVDAEPAAGVHHLVGGG